MKYFEYEVVHVNMSNGIMLKNYFVTLGIAQFKDKVKTESEKYFWYIISAKYSCQYIISIVMVV